MAKQLFGTDGIRGVAGEYPLDNRTVHAFGMALASVARHLVSLKVFFRYLQLEGVMKENPELQTPSSKEFTSTKTQ